MISPTPISKAQQIIQAALPQLRVLLPVVGCVLFATLPNMYATLFLKGVNHSPTPTVLGTALLLLAVAVISGRPRRILMILAPFMIAAPAMCVLMDQVNSQLSRWALLVVIEGNAEELGRFARSAVVAVVGTVVAALFAWRLIRRSSPVVLPWRVRLGMGAAGGAVLLWLVLPDLLSAKKDRVENSLYKLQVTYPFGSLFEIWKALEDRRGLIERQGLVARVSKGKRIPPPVEKRSIHVLVIGESARYQSLSVNGYERDTTPLLKARKDLIWFPNMTACATITRHSLPLLLTGLSADRFADTNTAPSLISTAGETGYATYWFSTQFRQGIASKASAYYAPDAQTYRFLCLEMGQSYFSNAAYDEDLIPLFKNVLADKSRDALVNLHTMGSHWLFTARYPPQFEKWPTDGLDANAILSGRLTSPGMREKMRNAYDNTLLYTDWVVHTLLDELAKEDALASFWYVSDHGENGMDNVDNPFRHGLVSREVLHVPAFVWFSPQYRSTYPEVVRQIESHASLPLTSRMLFHTRLEVVGIESKVQNDELNLASPRFKPEAKRLVMALDGTVVDYDKDVKE